MLLSLLALLLLALSACAQDVIHGRTVAVVDGDTIKVLTAEKQLLRIRLGFIDAPESGQAFGQRARQTMSELVFDRDVELRFHTVERYGRLVCAVFVDGTDVGLELVKVGLAWVYEHYLPEASSEIQQSYTAAEAAAWASEWASGSRTMQSRLGRGADWNELNSEHHERATE
jgi:endonuclease YncB( thermonuclease family)